MGGFTLLDVKACYSNQASRVLGTSGHVDQRNRRGNPEIDPHTYAQLIFYKGTKAIRWRKGQTNYFNK